MSIFRNLLIMVAIILSPALNLYAQILPSGTGDSACQGITQFVSPITLTEQLNDDFNLTTAVGETLVFEPTSGTFTPGAGTVSFSTGDVNAQINVTSSQIIVTLNAGSATSLSSADILTISDLQITSTNIESIEIRYVSGSASVNGLAVNDPVATIGFLAIPAGANDAVVICGDQSVAYDLQLAMSNLGNNVLSNFSWYADENPNTSGEGADGSTEIYDYISNVTTGAEVVTYHITPTSISGACVGPEYLITVTVNPRVQYPGFAKSTTYVNECVGNTVTYTTDPGVTTYSWSVVNEANIVSGGGSTDDFVTVEWPGTATSGSVTLSHTNSFGCSTAPFVQSVQVEDNGPSAPNTSSSAVCSNAGSLFDLQAHVNNNGNAYNGTYEYIAADNPATTGESTTLTAPGYYITDAVFSPSGSVENIVYTVSGTNSSSGCAGAPFSVTVPINPMPIGETDLAEVCSGVGVLYDPQDNVNGGGGNGVPATFSWTSFADPEVSGASSSGTGSIVDILINPTADLHAAYYTIVGTSASGCQGPSFDVAIHANPVPLIEGPASVCAGLPFVFFATNPSGVLSWGSTGGPSQVSGGGSGDDYSELNWPTITAASVSVSYTNSYGCAGLASLPVAITNQNPAGASDTYTACGDAAINFDPQSTINSLGNAVPATFSWVAADNANTTGESVVAQTENIITDVVSNTGTSGEAVVYTVTPTGACGIGSTFQVTVTVNPTPLGSTDNIVTCTNNGAINYDLQANVNANNGLSSTFTWIAADNPSTEGESTSDPQSGSFIDDNPFIFSGTDALIEYSVTPTSAAGCIGQAFTVNIGRQAAPTAPGTSGSGCSGTPVNFDLQNYINTIGNGVTTSFSWKALSDNTNLTGESLSPQLSSVITDVLTSAVVGKQSILYEITPESTSGGCAGSVFTLFFELNATPQASNGIQAACSPAMTNIDLAAQYAATGNGVPVSSFGWQALANGNVSGETTLNQATTLINDVLINATINPENVVYSIVPVGVDGCTGAAFTQTVTVNPVPSVIITNNAPVISNNSATNITLSSSIAGSTFDFTVSAPAAITGATSGSGAIISQTLTNTTTTPQIATYTITATANACSGSSFVTTVTINGMRTIITADSVALVSLFNALGGPGWTQNTNWLSGPASTWHGISVSSERVISVALPTNNLTGSLPAGFFNLSQLSLLDLQNNAVSGTLPPEVGDLSSLQILDVRENHLTGTLPAELYSITSLTQLRLSGNDFTGALLPAISNLTNLQTLQAENLPMTGPIPSEVFGLTSLINLGLSGKINGPLPSTIAGLTSLLTLSCDSCGITSIPSSINSLANLVSLRLYNNSLQTLPNMTSLPLSTIDVGKNSLTFESLEPYTAVGSFNYSPQDTVGLASTVVLQTTLPHNFVSNVGGSASVFVWKKNNIVIPSATASAYTIASPVFTDEGVYHAEVTNTLLPALTLTTSPVTAKVSSLKRDSLSLLQIYNATGGPSWTTKGGWPNGNLSSWNGVVITSNRVTALNLPNNNLEGILPAEFTDLRSLQTSNLSGNKLSSIPLISSMTNLTNLNVAQNNLQFGSLEPNASVLAKLSYAPQNVIGTISQDSIAAGTPLEFTATASGTNNLYQWKRNNNDIAGATSAGYNLASLDRQNMGTYVCEVKNSAIPGLTLLTAPKTVLATAALSGKILVATNTPAEKGKVVLYRVNTLGAFDVIKTQNINSDGTYTFNKIVLDEYQVCGFADTISHQNALPTYFPNTILWEEADTLSLTGVLTDIDIVSAFKPSPPSGRGLISGTVIEEVTEGSGGRTKLPKPVRNSGVSARRVQNTGRGQEEILTLVAYVFTNENGEFALSNLPEGNYRLNIQYPGFPMDEKSFINFTIGTGLASEVKVEAQVDKGVINVRQLIITEAWSRENYKAEVFPNPTSSIIRMKFDTHSSYRDVGIFDATGKQITKTQASDATLEINVEDLSKGMYLLHVNENGARVKTLHVIIE